MATENMNVPLCEGHETVRVGVVFTTIPESKNCVVISEDGRTVDYTSGKDERFHPEILQRLTESIFSGYNGALLTCGASTDKINALIDHNIIKQFHPDGSAVDLLSPSRQTLKLMMHPVLGRCSSLFSVTVEWKLHPEEVESEVCRSRLQLFSLTGGASRTDLRGGNS
ncbi:hypothetical protein PAMP_023653 [Pampus punctatissimus]